MNDTNTLLTLSSTASLDTLTMQKFNSDITLVDDAILQALNLHSRSISPQSTISNVEANVEMAAFFQQIIPSYKSAINPLISFFKLLKKNEYINQIISFEKIEWNNHCIQFKYPLEINMQIIDGFWEGYYEDLDMYIVASDAEQFKKDFQEEFFVMWQVYANEPDEKLTRKARDIKYKILDSIKGVFSED
jgi:hypothetical protein